MSCGCNKQSKYNKPSNIPDAKKFPRKNIIKRIWETSKKSTKSVTVNKINKK